MPSLVEPYVCPQCGSTMPGDTLDGLCPICLLVAGLPEANSGNPDDSSTGLTAELSDFGCYHIIGLVNEGGMGLVYLAEQREPVRRRVALKVLKDDPASAAAIGRFKAESQALALMDHPNIGRVYDGGITPGGRHYFAMEYVPGKPITDYCDDNQLDIRERLSLFTQVCQAVDHAHRKGVVHRDLKPSNVLVTLYDNRTVAKVIDFGVVKAINQPLVEEALVTQLGMFIGTPEYVSPEQADHTAHDVDALTDIYSLGVLLYELLVGVLPIDSTALRTRELSDIKRLYREQAVPKLSTRLNPASRTAVEIARRRRTDVRTLTRMVRGDLERITMKALENDRTRRYSTASALASDIREIVCGKPVSPAKLRWSWVFLPTILLCAAAVILLGIYSRKPDPITYQRLTFRRGNITGARFTPADQTIVYSAAWDGGPRHIFSTIAGSRESRAFDLPSGRLLAVSSTSELAILLDNGSKSTLARVPLGGGAPREILDDAQQADWSPDGTTLAVVRTSAGGSRIEYPIGRILDETAGRSHIGIRVSPKGNLVAFYERDPEAGVFSVMIVGPGTPKRALSRGWRAIGETLAWSPTGNEVWFSAMKLGGDPAVRAVDLSGHERVVAESPGWMLVNDIARDGRLLVSMTNGRMALSYGEQNGVERDLSWLDTSFVSDISSDAKRLLFLELSCGKNANIAICLRKTDGSPAVLLGYGSRPSLSPDGKYVAAIGVDASQSTLFLLPAGAGEPKSLTRPGLHYGSVEWFPNGRQVLFTASENARQLRTYVQDLVGGGPRAVTPTGVRGSLPSPDGNAIVATSNGQYYIYPMSGGSARPIIGLEPGDQPIRWAADGHSLFVQGLLNGTAFKLYRLDLLKGKKKFLKQIGPLDPIGVSMANLVITPDGKSYAYSYQRDISTLYLTRIGN